ncbi:MAG: redox-regulated ATPase YchF [Candidatus Nomurabacteria bacterium]|jgi:GTP-binding protein YchF|nr:redox-regulated ATPase YchF [Candidatus Nomurabacteria bacterium]
MLKIGIVGLANVGKSTLFNALTNAGALAANYPFATIEPNTGIVPVPDDRLAILGEIYETAKIVPATVEFVDIAGLIAGASQGEGLGNKFLANIRSCKIICHVVRVFHDSNISHIVDKVNPKRDIEMVETELALADIEVLSRALEKARRDSKSGDKAAISRVSQIEVTMEELKSGKTHVAEIAGLDLLCAKPVFFMFNLDESELVDQNLRDELGSIVAPSKCVFVNAKLESEMADMSGDEKAEFLHSYGIAEDGLAQLVRVAYESLGLQSFLTAGKKEVRAWTVEHGATAPQAAGVIHTDFEKGFIAASICKYSDLARLRSEKAVREAGLMRTEGKDYVMQEGDVVEFRFNV